MESPVDATELFKIYLLLGANVGLRLTPRLDVAIELPADFSPSCGAERSDRLGPTQTDLFILF